MISSELRLNVLAEFVTKAIRTASSTPDSASLISSGNGPVDLTFGGKGFSRESGWAGASDRGSDESAQSVSSSELICATESESGEGLIKAAALSCELEACWTQPLANVRTIKATPILHFSKFRVFISFKVGVCFLAWPA